MNVLAASVPRYRLMTQRGAILAGVIALHVLGAVALAAAHLTQPPALEATVIDVVLTQDVVLARRPEALPTRLVEPRVEVPAPEVIFPIADPAPTAISVTTIAPETRPASDSGGDGPNVVISAMELKPPPLRYPAAAKRAGAQGTVILNVLIDTEGHVKDVRIHRTSGFQQLDVAALEAMWEALFKPYRVDGIARSVRGTYEVRFSLTIRTASAS